MKCETYVSNPEFIGPMGIDYGQLYYCPFQEVHFVALLMLFLWIFFLMNTLANTASNYFSPTLGSICDKLNLAYDIAGVTFLAFGNGAPDFFSLVASFSGEADVLVGLGALLGGSVFVCTIVVGSVAILCPCEVSRPIFLRDVSFHIIATTCVTIVSLTQNINLGFAISFLLIYVLYVVLVTVASFCGPQKINGMELSEQQGIPMKVLDIQFAGWHTTKTETAKKLGYNFYHFCYYYNHFSFVS
jgi:sodium/potassium/calcium exchanger 6